MTRPHRMSDDELATRGRVSGQELADWRARGLVLSEEDGSFGVEALERVRFLRFVRDRGIDPTEIVRVRGEEGDVLGRYIELLGGPRGLGIGFDELADTVALDPSFLRRFWTAAGLGEDDEAFDDDVAMLQALPMALDAGLPPDALLQAVRVFADSLDRVADAQARLFHFYVHERLKAEGLAGAELAAATGAASTPLMELVEPTILYFHRKAWARALREDLVLHLTEDVLDPAVVGEIPVAVLFVDLASFTPLTEAMGDTAAADVLDRFSELVRQAALACTGRVIKQIGDEFMLVFPSGRDAVRCGMEICGRTASESQFPSIRLGAHEGRALYREADYLGVTVNVAARVASHAERGQFLVTETVRDSASDLPSLVWQHIGTRELKGVAEPVSLFTVRPRDAPSPRPVDPVCGMELEADQCDYKLVHQGRELFFCSERCLDLFGTDPERYAPTPPLRR